VVEPLLEAGALEAAVEEGAVDVEEGGELEGVLEMAAGLELVEVDDGAAEAEEEAEALTDAEMDWESDSEALIDDEREAD
jgi:hypothetical protein